MARTPALIAVVITAFVCASCATAGSPPSTPPSAVTPSTSVTSASPSATPTPSWSAEQEAANQAVDDYRAAIGTIEVDPAAFSEAQMTAILKKVAGGEVVTSNVGSYLSLKKRGFRFDGETSVLTNKVSSGSDASYGREVFVTRCLDQRALRVLDKDDREVTDSALGYSIPDFNLRQYTVVKRTGTPKFLVYGLAAVKGECGP